MAGYLANESDPVTLVLDLYIDHEHFGSSSDPSTFNGYLHYSNDIDRSLNETVTDKIGKYRSDYYNLQVHRETDLFFSDLGVNLV